MLETRKKSLKNSGGFGRSWLARTRLMTFRWMASCRHWVNCTGGMPRCLMAFEILVRRVAGAERAELVGGGDRILDRHVDAHAADRRHRMRRIANADKPRPAPFSQPIDRHAQQLDVVPALQFAIRSDKKRRHFDQPSAECFEAVRLMRSIPPLE